MLISRLAVVVPLFALAGCWPYLGGPYEDYVDGEGSDDLDTSDRDTSDRDTSDRDTSDRDTSDRDTDDPDSDVVGDGPTLFGVVASIQYMGGYWGQDADIGLQSAFIGAGATGLGWTYGSTFAAVGECSGGSSLFQDSSSMTIDAGLPNSVSVGVAGQSMSLTPWDDDPNVRVGGTSESTTPPFNASVDINTSVDDGSVNGVLTRMPGDFTWSEPDIDGESIFVYPREPFNVLWSGTGNDTVVATFLFQDGDFQILGGGGCTVAGGGFSINATEAPVGTEFIELRLERITEYSGLISGSGGVESVVAGSLAKRGYIALEAEE